MQKIVRRGRLRARPFGKRRISLFWRSLSAMLIASAIGAIATVYLSSVLDNQRIDNLLRSPVFEQRLRNQLIEATPLLSESRHSPDLCADVLQHIAGKTVGDLLPDTAGLNRFWRAAQEKRLFLTYRWPNGDTCRFPRGDPDSWEQAALSRVGADPGVHVTSMYRATQPKGWSSVLRLRTNEGSSGILTLGFHVLPPFSSLMSQRDVTWKTVWAFILVISTFSVLTLVPLLVRRIKRAEKAASAWAHGDLTARIGDTKNDEFGRLSQRFDEMADTLSGMIEVKSALAAADERNRLARDLHDTAKQRTFALGLQLTALRKSHPENSEAARIATAAISLVSHLQQDLADVIRSLSAPTIAEIGLRRALSESIGDLLSGSNVSWTLLFSQEDETRLARTPEIARQLLAISTECCANVLKHANATQMNLIIHAEGALFTLRISDNGQGFDPRRAEATPGMGLSNMRLRASSLPSGTLNLATDIGNGTIVTITFRAPL